MSRAVRRFRVTRPDLLVKPLGMLYRLEGTGIKIAGATSSAPLDRAQVPRWLQHVFDDADRVVFATDSEQIDPTAFLLPAHQSLTVLSFFQAVSALWQQLEIPGHPAKCKPWIVSAHLRSYLGKLLAPGAELLLLAEAKRRREPPRFLETAQEWMAAFDAVPLEEQLDQLERVVASPEETASFEVALHEAWTAHDLKAMDALLAARRQTQPSFCAHTLDGRNQRWLPILMRLIVDSATAKRALDTLVIVEAWHLCGPQGLTLLLTNENQTLTRLL